MSDETNEHVPNFIISKQEASGVIGGWIYLYIMGSENGKMRKRHFGMTLFS